jgi:hypothetical protein
MDLSKIKSNLARVFGWDSTEVEGLTEMELDAKLEGQKSIAELNELSNRVVELENQIAEAATAQIEAEALEQSTIESLTSRIETLESSREEMAADFNSRLTAIEEDATAMATEVNRVKANNKGGAVAPVADAAGVGAKLEEIEEGDKTVKISAEELKGFWN